MDDPTLLLKRTLRAQARARRRALTDDQRREDAQRLAALVASLPETRDARTLALFAPFDGELDPTLLLDLPVAAGKIAAWPRIDPQTDTLAFFHHPTPQPLGTPGAARALIDSMPLGRWGLREAQGPPIEPQRIDLILTPGALFSTTGARLGLGKGHYDRFLAAHPCNTLGVGFDWQLVEDLPTEPHDQPLTLIATPLRVVRTRDGATTPP